MNPEAELPAVTGELLTALEWRYAVPRSCRVCGTPLTTVSAGGPQGIRMCCPGDAASPLKYRHEAAGVTWKEALVHWEESTLYNPPEGDRRVLALVAEVRRLRGEAGNG